MEDRGLNSPDDLYNELITEATSEVYAKVYRNILQTLTEIEMLEFLCKLRQKRLTKAINTLVDVEELQSGNPAIFRYTSLEEYKREVCNVWICNKV